MNHGSLFSGIGGFDLAAQWMGWDNKFHCEWNEFGQKVLKHYWPEAASYEDINTTDFTIHRGRIDILSGGFPCQPYSTAGKRLGKEDDRHLWPQMCRAVREIRPGWVVGENVRGLTNWNDGLVFDEVQADLENEGYEVMPFLLPAVAVNAPHRRDRIWFIAKDSMRIGLVHGEAVKEGTSNGEQRDTGTGSKNRIHLHEGAYSYTDSIGQQRQGRAEGQEYTEKKGNWKEHRAFHDSGWQHVNPVCSGNDGISERLDGITFSDWHEESIKAYGNAIVPHVALQIFKAIQQYENENN